MKSDLERVLESDDLRIVREWALSEGGQFIDASALEKHIVAIADAIATRDAEIERLTAARNLAYGLLWGMSIDRRRVSDDLAARARETLLATMSKDDQRAGIDAARAALSNKDAG